MNQWRCIVDKEHLKGGAQDIKGKVKEKIGSATGNRDLEAEGKMDQVEGKTRKVVGDVKDAIKGK
jgi:uncharacterized protein YjbJ (UPF0337 family)